MAYKLILHRFGPFEHLELTLPTEKVEGKARVFIFTGPNGCGKSSLLRALAYQKGQPEPIDARFWDDQSWFAIGPHLPLIYAPLNSQVNLQEVLQQAFGGACVGKTYEQGQARDAIIGAYRGQKADEKRLSVHEYDANKHGYAAAYSGHRQLKNAPIQAMAEVKIGTIREDNSFEHSQNTDQILQWLANRRTKEALERMSGNLAVADTHKQAVARVEGAIRQLTGLELRFVIETEPLEVVVELEGKRLGIEILADGLKSIIAWIGDLLMRLDLRGVKGNIFEKRMHLYLDEIDIHLHPKWQRQILPALQGLFTNADIFVSTHSPFVVGSVSDAWVYRFKLENGLARLDKMMPSKAGSSLSLVLDEVFGVSEAFDLETEAQLNRFYALKDQLLGGDEAQKEALLEQAQQLSAKGQELRDLIDRELRQLSRISKQRISLL